MIGGIFVHGRGIGDCFTGRLESAGVAGVTGREHAAPVLLLDLSLGLLGIVVLIEVEDHHVGPLFGECDGDGAADAAISALARATRSLSLPEP